MRGRLILQGEGHVKGSGEGFAIPQRLERGEFGFTDLVPNEVEGEFFVVTLDGKHLLENRLQAGGSPVLGSDFLLKELPVGVQLHFDQVGRFNYLFNFPKIESFY